MQKELSVCSSPFQAEGILFLYTNDPCIIIGRNQNPWLEVTPTCTLPVIRRSSGGGTVYQDRGNLNWSFILPRSWHDPLIELHQIITALGRLGILAKPKLGRAIFVQDKKVSGVARRYSAHFALHHGTLLIESDLKALQNNLRSCPTKEEAGYDYKIQTGAIKSRYSPVTNIGTLVRTEADTPCVKGPALVDTVIGAIARQCCEASASFNPQFYYSSEKHKIISRLSSWDWTFGQCSDFFFSLAQDSIGIEVKRGIITKVTLSANADVQELVGKKFNYKEVHTLLKMYNFFN